MESGELIGMDLSQATWRKSSRSGGEGGNCIEVTASRMAVAVRDSKNPLGSALVFSSDEWKTFLRDVKRGNLGDTA